MQPYGIHLGHDLAGLLVCALYVAASWPFVRSAAGRWTVVAALATLSGVGSIPVLAQAMSRGDITVATYHLVWVLVAAVTVAKAHGSYKQRATVVGAIHATSNTDAASAYYTNGRLRPQG